jgi:hypothetical protein
LGALKVEHGALQQRAERAERKNKSVNKQPTTIPPPPTEGGASSNEASLQASIAKLVEKNDAMASDLKVISSLLLPSLLGQPPYVLSMQLTFPGDTEPHPLPITFQLAHEEMPYTSLFFARQVLAELWDGTKIIRNAGHVIQMDPRPQERMHAFRDAGLKSVAFQEYNPKFPHVKNTLGLAGRPGGPDFYISIIDNTKNHGPGGQGQYAIPSEADPAFAFLLSGEEVVEKIKKMQTKNDGFRMLEEFVEINSIRFT